MDQTSRNDPPPSDPRQFIAHIRALQAQYKAYTTSRGSQEVVSKQKNAIKAAIASEPGLTARFNGLSNDSPLYTLLLRFEKTCWIQGIDIPGKARAGIYSILLSEMDANVTAFGFEKKPEKMIPLTLYQGTDFIAAINEEQFAPLRDGKINHFTTAATGYPENPRRYLKLMLKEAEKGPGNRFEEKVDRTHPAAELAKS